MDTTGAEVKFFVGSGLVKIKLVQEAVVDFAFFDGFVKDVVFILRILNVSIDKFLLVGLGFVLVVVESRESFLVVKQCGFNLFSFVLLQVLLECILTLGFYVFKMHVDGDSKQISQILILDLLHDFLEVGLGLVYFGE